MKIKVGVLAVLVLFTAGVTAQNVKISGRVVDKVAAQPIEYANVSLMKQDSTVITGIYSDADGLFTFNNPSGDYLVSVTYMGYQTCYTPVKNNSGNQDLGNISIEPSSVMLQDVTVTAQSVINKADRKLITPSAEQVKASTNGFDLLRKLQLARIEVNPLTNAVTSVGDGEVQLRVNGVKVTNAEIQALRPDEIIRIEFHDDPGVRYGNAAAVIDYITKRRVSGANVNGDLMNNVSSGLGFAEDYLAVKYNNKKSEFSANAYYNYRDIDWVQANNETFVFPDKSINRAEIGEPTRFRRKELNTALNYSLMDKDNYYFNATFRYIYGDTPNAYSDRNSKIETSYNSVPLSISDHSTENSKSPALDLYFQKDLKNGQLLIFNVVGTYIDSKNTRLYQEHRAGATVTDIYSDISGSKYSLIAEGIYERKMGNGKLTGGMKHSQVYTENEYKGNTIANISMKQADTKAYAEYQIKVGKFSYMANIAATRFFYSQAGESQKSITFQPSARVNYNPNDNLYFRYRLNVWNNIPSLSNLNNVEQAIDSLQIRRGNPNLKSFLTYQQSIAAGYNKGIIGIDLYTQYQYQNKPVMESIFYEDGAFIRTYENQKSHQHLMAQLTIRIKPFKDNLSVSFTPGINHYISKGNDYSHKYTNRYFRVNVDGSYKNVMGTFMYNTPWDYFYGEGSNGGERLHMLGLGYKRQKWSVMLAAFNPFGGVYEQKSENRAKLNPVNTRVSTENLTRMYVAKFTFNLDFGRKFSGGDKRINNSDTDSGIMSGAK
ncbi:TonB-dependent receptor [Dysgonomonas macrotermitis]|uniref:CarboxypepD_reg-like domain-containing protein n=1 Tax=Dysgonomonas macrotermitis TaxID=1346286 RepID=A0A1M5F309_9BACT|nr:TonB-dependent receptor [Dysgonomonas macrotermitis]SHF85738.1 CarboxypepD_reg-like domain-containing protein [Dysgonomonas macrotermitis]